MRTHDILLESGTNEVEIAEVLLGPQHFGINVAKIREFRPFKGQDYQYLPDSHPSVMGLFEFRGDMIPLIHLKKHLSLPSSPDSDTPIIVVTEFNNLTTGFITDGIESIHRISWEDFKPLGESLAANVHQITGSVTVDGRRILVLDMEQILGEILPSSIINYEEKALDRGLGREERGKARIFFAEDSTLIRTSLLQILEEVGYREVRAFNNGRSALEAITAAANRAREEGRALRELVSLVLTDIEMPQLDGLALCREIKLNLKLQVPVIMFSSLINEQMAIKCREVGADAYVAKPETVRLVELIDSFSRPPSR